MQQPVSSSSASNVGDAAKKNGETVNQTPPVTAAGAEGGVSPDPGDGGVAATINANINSGVGTKKRTRGGTAKAANGVNGEPKAKRTKMTRAAAKDGGVRQEEVEGDGVGEKDADAEGEVVDENENGSGNESSA